MRPLRQLCLLVACVLLAGILAANHSAEDEAAGSSFVLLHSALGYERLGTKQALIRAVRDDLNRDDALDLAASSAILTSTDGVHERYRVQYAGKTFGNHFWRIDFSSLMRSGEGFQLIVDLRLTGDGKKIQLRSDPFKIADDLLFKSTFPRLALENAQARRAPAAMGGGYFDCNTRMGEAYSHAMLAVGLLAVLERRGSALAPETKQKLVELVEVALDYVVGLQQRDGHIVDQHPSRPFQGLNPGLLNTTLGVYGLGRGAAVLPRFDKAKAAHYLKAAERGFDYLRLRKSNADMVTLAALLYRASRNSNYLGEAASYARFVSRQPDRLTPGERSLEALPYNEGLMDLVELAPDHPDWIRWVHDLLDHGIKLYREAARQNVFHICPWDKVGQAPTELVPFETCRTSHFSRVAYSALRMTELFPGPGWEPTTTASLQWVVGLNFGLPGNRVVPASANAITSASFITHTGTRYAQQLTAEFQWQAPTIVNGFTDRFRYENVWQAAETFILHDGLWLMAVSRYGTLPSLAVQTTTAGKSCPSRYQIRVGESTVTGTTDPRTGNAEVVLRAWGEAELVLFDGSRQIRVPFFAGMGARIAQHIDLQEHVLASIRPENPSAGSPIKVWLDVRNVGTRPTRAQVHLQSEGVKLNGSDVILVTLRAGEQRSFLLELTSSSSSYLLLARVEWKYGSQRACLYGTSDELPLPVRVAGFSVSSTAEPSSDR